MNAMKSFRKRNTPLADGNRPRFMQSRSSLFYFFPKCSAQEMMAFGFKCHASGYGTPAANYDESNMVFWNPYGLKNLIWEGSGVSPNPENGTSYLQVSTGAGLGFTFTSGMHFDLHFFDAAEYPTSPNLLTRRILGYKSMGGTVTNYFTLDGINDGAGPQQDFQTSDSQFLNVYRVDVLTGTWSLDNLVISGVPEPSSGALVIFGTLCGLGWSRGRRKFSRS